MKYAINRIGCILLAVMLGPVSCGDSAEDDGDGSADENDDADESSGDGGHGDKQVGESCTAPQGPDGVDECELGAYCYYVDAQTNLGTCIAVCTESGNDPACPANHLCSIVVDDVLVCREKCDPVLQDCTREDSSCLQAPGTMGFVCITDASGEESGDYRDECQFLNGCDPGLFCAASEAVPNCTGAQGCCTPFCDVDEANSCPGLEQGQECVPWFESPVPGYEHVGGCLIVE